MPNFSLVLYDLVQGRDLVFKLYKDSYCEYDEFCIKIHDEGNLLSELKTIVTRLELVAKGQVLPREKYKPIDLGNSSFKGYEVKTPNLRVYLIHQTQKGKIIICGGKKSTQDNDIRHFKKLAKQYEDFLNN